MNDQARGRRSVVLSERYEGLKRVDARGMGELFRGRDVETDADVAVRVLAPEWTEHAASVDRFVEETCTGSDLGHPALIEVFDVGQTIAGRGYVVSPWIEGRSLEELLARKIRWEPENVAALLAPIASALDELHAATILHRLVSPSKILIDTGGAHPRAVLTGYGVGSLVAPAPEEDGRPTARTSSPTHLDYLAPESDVGASASGPLDVYSLATIAYRLLTGRVPFPGARTIAGALAERQGRTPPTLQRAARVPYPRDVEEVIAAGLAPEAEDRFQTAGAFIGDLYRASCREPRLGIAGDLAPIPLAATEAALRFGLGDRGARSTARPGVEPTRKATDVAAILAQVKPEGSPKEPPIEPEPKERADREDVTRQYPSVDASSAADVLAETGDQAGDPAGDPPEPGSGAQPEPLDGAARVDGGSHGAGDGPPRAVAAPELSGPDDAEDSAPRPEGGGAGRWLFALLALATLGALAAAGALYLR